MQAFPGKLRNIAEKVIPHGNVRNIYTLLERGYCVEDNVCYSEIHHKTLEHLAIFHNYLAAVALFAKHRSAFCNLSRRRDQSFDVKKLDLQLLIGKEHASEYENINLFLNSGQTTSELDSFLSSQKNEDDRPREKFPPKYVSNFIRNLRNQYSKLEKCRKKNKNVNISSRIQVALDVCLWRQRFDIEVPSRVAPLEQKRLEFGCDYKTLRKTIFSIADFDEPNCNSDETKLNAEFLICVGQLQDDAGIVPIYVPHFKQHIPKVKIVKIKSNSPDTAQALKTPKRYDAVRSLYCILRCGEGIPRTIQYYYAYELIEDILRCGNSEIAQNYLKFLGLPEDRNGSIDLHFASAQERIFLWNEEDWEELEEKAKENLRANQVNKILCHK